MSSRIRRGAVVGTIVAVPLCAACATILGFDNYSSESAGAGRCSADGAFVLNPQPLFDNQVDGIVNADRRGVYLSEDENQIYFGMDTVPEKIDSGTDGGSTLLNWKLYVATRGSRDQKFGTPQGIPGLNQFYSQRHPTFANDGRMILFSGQESDKNDNHTLFYATRDGDAGAFRPPQQLSDRINERGYNLDPFLYTPSDAGKELWYVHIDDASRSETLRHARILNDDLTASGSFEEPAVFNPTPNVETTPVLSADGLELYFSREETDASGNANIWRMRRATTADTFAGREKVEGVNSDFFDRPGWLSPDGCRLYLLSSRGTNSITDGALNIYVAERPKTSP